MPVPQNLEWTAERFLALPESKQKMELLDGELVVSPSPTSRHSWVVQALCDALRDYLEGRRVGWAVAQPHDFVFSSRRVVQPDVFVLPWQEQRPMGRLDPRTLLLVVEVLSPSSIRYDRIAKREYYRSASIPEYWIVDHEARLIERWRPGDERPEPVSQTLTWHVRADLPPFTLDVRQFFTELFGPA